MRRKAPGHPRRKNSHHTPIAPGARKRPLHNRLQRDRRPPPGGPEQPRHPLVILLDTAPPLCLLCPLCSLQLPAATCRHAAARSAGWLPMDLQPARLHGPGPLGTYSPHPVRQIGQGLVSTATLTLSNDQQRGFRPDAAHRNQLRHGRRIRIHSASGETCAGTGNRQRRPGQATAPRPGLLAWLLGGRRRPQPAPNHLPGIRPWPARGPAATCRHPGCIRFIPQCSPCQCRRKKWVHILSVQVAVSCRGRIAPSAKRHWPAQARPGRGAGWKHRPASEHIMHRRSSPATALRHGFGHGEKPACKPLAPCP